jgi:hypothetical protein
VSFLKFLLSKETDMDEYCRKMQNWFLMLYTHSDKIQNQDFVSSILCRGGFMRIGYSDEEMPK